MTSYNRFEKSDYSKKNKNTVNSTQKYFDNLNTKDKDNQYEFTSYSNKNTQGTQNTADYSKSQVQQKNNQRNLNYRKQTNWNRNQNNQRRNTYNNRRRDNSDDKPFWSPCPEVAALGQEPLSFSFPKDLDKTRSCPNYDMVGRCEIGADCRFAHGPNELRVLPDSLRDKQKCRLGPITECKTKRDICMYWHEEEADFSLNNQGIKRNNFQQNKKILYGNPPFKKEMEQTNKLGSQEFPNWINRLLKRNRYLDSKELLRQVRNCKQVKQDIEKKQDAMKIILQGRDLPTFFNLINESYKKYHHNLLWLEELQNFLDYRQYDLHGVSIMPDQNLKGLYIIRVPGIAEKRPNVLRGDQIFIQEENIDNEFEIEKMQVGQVHFTNIDNIQVSINTSVDLMKKYTVSFGYIKTLYQLMHRSVDMFEKFFQKMQYNQLTVIPDKEQPGQQLNKLQSKCITSILDSPSMINVFQGPPGTGKTHNIVEMIKIAQASDSSKKVILTAPSNQASDLLCLRMKEFVLAHKLKMLRLNPQHRGPKDLLSFEIAEFCNQESFGWGKKNDIFRSGKISFQMPSKMELAEFDIIVTTCISSGFIQSLGVQNVYDYIIIDEAGEAMEYEVFIPMQNASQSTKIVLAGDHLQLGPIIRSELCLSLEMDKSILEKSVSFFSEKISCNRLIESYRAHPKILRLYNELFQNKVLECHKPDDDHFKLKQKSVLQGSNAPLKVFNCETIEAREEDSPSFQNDGELEIIKKLLVDLLTKDKILPDNIGILTAYRKQEDKIKNLLFGMYKYNNILNETIPPKDIKIELSELNKIKFGTVETFQGQERDVIIISNVRATEKLLKHDKKFQLGFSENFKRLNVAISRAKELLLIVGKVSILDLNEDWKKLLEILRTQRGQEGCIEMDMFREGCEEHRHFRKTTWEEEGEWFDPKSKKNDKLEELNKSELVNVFNEDIDDDDEDDVADNDYDRPFRDREV